MEKKPDGLYKYSSFHMQLSKNRLITNRQSYALLDYFGDIGGLIDFLQFFVGLVISPFLNYNI